MSKSWRKGAKGGKAVIATVQRQLRIMQCHFRLEDADVSCANVWRIANDQIELTNHSIKP